jgi:hypothetical protein
MLARTVSRGRYSAKSRSTLQPGESVEDRWIKKPHSPAFAFPPTSPDGSVEAPTVDRRIFAKSHDRRFGEKSAIAKKNCPQPPQQSSQFS